MAKNLKILGIDPGTTFSAFSIIQVRTETFRGKDTVKSIKWIHSGLFRNLLKTVDSNTQKNSRSFIRDIRYLLKTYNPDCIVIESFMQRSFRSNLASPISIMIGLVLGMATRRRINVITVMPSTWKKKLEKDFKKVDDIYDLTYPVKQRLPPHVIDSFFQALYASGDSCYQTLTDKQIETIKRKIKVSISLLKDVEFVSNLEKERLRINREKLKNKKSRKKK